MQKTYKKKCAICGEEFESEKSYALFCSLTCQLLAKRRRERLRRDPKAKSYILKCTMCGSLFETHDSRRKYCNKCKKEAEEAEGKILHAHEDMIEHEEERLLERAKQRGAEYKTLTEKNAEARAKGLSYGQLQALKYIEQMRGAENHGI